MSFRSENYQKCESMRLGELEQKVIKNGECFDYKLDIEKSDIEVFY